MSGHRRTSGIILACLCFALAWAVTIGGGAAGNAQAWAIVLFATAMLIFAIAETLISLSIAPIVNDLAPDKLRGRYNGAFGLAWSGGYMLGPLIAGLALARGDAYPLFLVFIGGFAITAIGAARLERSLPTAANRVGFTPAEAPRVAPEETKEAR
jgi:MFS family permease